MQGLEAARARQKPVDLSTWDWRAAAAADDRGLTWLARKTNRAASTVYRYSYGTLTPPEAWLRDVARLLGVEVAA